MTKQIKNKLTNAKRPHPHPLLKGEGDLIIKLLICLLGFLLICLFPVPKAQAQQSSFTVSPPRNEITLYPGQTYTNDIQITNNNDFPIAISANVNDFIVSDQNGTPQPVTDNSSVYGLQSWITLSTNQLRIAPHQSDYLTYTITTPRSIIPGGHYGIITFSPIQQRGGLISVSSQIASLIIVSVPGQITEKAKIESLKVNYNWQEDKIKIETTIKNQGNIHIKPIIYLSISSMFGEFVGIRTLPIYNIFPGASRVYKGQLQIPWWLPGKYTLKIFVSYGQNNSLLLSKTGTFWAIPQKSIIIVALGLIFFIMFISFICFRKIIVDTCRNILLNLRMSSRF